MSKFGTKQIIPICTALLSIIWIMIGLNNYGFWAGATGPTPGFVPTIIAIIMLIVSILAFLQSFKEEQPVYPVENWMVILAGYFIFGMTFLIGMLPSLALYVVLWLKVYEKVCWKSTLIVLAVIMSIVIGVFVLWLGVPFPKGALFTALLG